MIQGQRFGAGLEDAAHTRRCRLQGMGKNVMIDERRCAGQGRKGKVQLFCRARNAYEGRVPVTAIRPSASRPPLPPTRHPPSSRSCRTSWRRGRPATGHRRPARLPGMIISDVRSDSGIAKSGHTHHGSEAQAHGIEGSCAHTSARADAADD